MRIFQVALRFSMLVLSVTPLPALPLSVLPLSGFLSSSAHAGPNAGGVLVVHDVGLTMAQTDGNTSLCGQGSVPHELEDVDARIDGAHDPQDPALFRVYAVFPGSSNPRLMGVAWAIRYPETELFLSSSAMCGEFEWNDAMWPRSGTFSQVIWMRPQTGRVTPVYWFAAYTLGAFPSQFSLIPDEYSDGAFGDDSIPAVLDPIAGFGSLGFDQDGVVPPAGGYPGACCQHLEGTCRILLSQECGDEIFLGPGTACLPDPCGTGACCGGTSFYCQDLSRADCDAIGGRFLGLRTNCQNDGEFDCTAPIWGACCSGEECTVTQRDSCSGLWMEPFDCYPTPCHDVGACCLPSGECRILEGHYCNVIHGIFHGPGVPCSPELCLVPPTPIERKSWGAIKNTYR